MNLDLAAELCRRFEGYRAKPYLCPANVATIGYGSTYYADGRKVTLEDPPMDEPTARALLMAELLHTYAPGAYVCRSSAINNALAVGSSIGGSSSVTLRPSA